MAEKSKKLMRLLVLSLPAVTLLGSYIALPSNRSVNLFVLVMAVLAALGLWIAVTRRPARPFGSAAGYCAFYIVMLVYAGISLIWVKNFASSLFAYYYQIVGIASVLFIAAAVKNRKSLYTLFDVLTVCYIAILLLGVLEIFTGRYLFSPANPELILKNTFHYSFPYACFANTNDFSTYITLFMPFVAYDLLIRLKGAAGKFSAALLCAVALFALVNANARACWFAVSLMCVALTVTVLFKNLPRKALKPTFAALGVALIAIAAVVIKSGFFTRGVNSLTMHNHSVSERYMLITGALKMLVDYHLMGVGVGNSVNLIPYYTASIFPFNLHNMTLQILTEYGMIIFAFYAVLLIVLAVRFFRFRSGKMRDDMLSYLCFAVVCAYPLVGIASSDMTHLTSVWAVVGILLACLRIFYPVPAKAAGLAGDTTAAGKKLLFISFIDFGDMTSGSSVRPQRMYEAFRELGYEISLLSGLQNRKRERLKNVHAKYRELKKNGLPDFCYVEPPSGPFFNFCDHLMLIWLKRCGVPIGLFYRDAYWKFADWWPVSGLKRFFLILMHRFDLFVIKRTCKIVFYPTQSMAALFEMPCKDVLPPAGADFVAPEHALYHRALYVGGVSKNYGTDLLLKAFEIVNEREKKNIMLTVVCRASEQSDFFTGYVGRPWLELAHASGDEQLGPIYACSDITIYPSRRDFYMDFCMPVKLFEYLSRALPVVCTGCKEAAAFVDANGIGLVAEDNPESIAEKVIQLYETPELIGEIRGRCIKALRGGNQWVHRAQKAADKILN
jgi:glycosyltransferase involved in cell wall biosynthesis